MDEKNNNPLEPTNTNTVGSEATNTSSPEQPKVSQDFEDFTIAPDGSTRKIELTTEPAPVGPEPYNPSRYSNKTTYDVPPANYSTGNGQPYQGKNNYQSPNHYNTANNYQQQKSYQAPPSYTPPRNQHNNNRSQNYQSSPNYRPPGQNQGYYREPPINVNVQVNGQMNGRTPVSPKSKVIMIVLCCLGFVGFAGIHRFYAGKIGTGILWFFTGGFCVLGTIIDLILILTDQFTDYYGAPILYN